MKLSQLNDLIKELNFRVNKQKEIESFLKCKTKDGIIRLDGKVYGPENEEDVMEILNNYQDRIFELEEMEI